MEEQYYMTTKTSNNILKVLLIDDQQIFTESLSICVSNYAKDIEIVGTGCNGEEAIRMAKELQPHIIVMDARMPILDGVEAVRIIKKAMPQVQIIMLSTYQEDILVRNALLAGASGYLLKDISPKELITAIRALKSGVMQISPEIIQKLVNEHQENKKRELNLIPEFHELTNREQEIATLIINGHSNEQIAEELHLAVQTVRNQVSNIYFKLGVKDRFEMIQRTTQ